MCRCGSSNSSNCIGAENRHGVWRQISNGRPLERLVVAPLFFALYLIEDGDTG